MKKLIASIVALIAISASAYDVTNTVTIVSNIYNRISEEHWITNNIKNTHSNYYYTNNVYTVSNVTLLVSQQTFKTNTTVNLDVSQQAIADARAQANLASSYANDALDYANEAADSATEAQGHAADAKDYMDTAEYYMEQAHGQVQPIIDEGQRQLAAVQSAGNTQTGRVTSEGNYQVGRVNSAGSSNVGSVNSAGTTALNNINSKQQWFEEHFGRMVTNYNFYSADKLMARGGNIYGIHKYVLYINGVKHPEHWVIIDFSTYSSASSGNDTWVYTIWSQSQENKTSNHSYIYTQQLHASYPKGLIRDERSGRNYFNMFTTSSGYSVLEAYQCQLVNPRNAYPNSVLTHLKYSGYEYKIDDDPIWDVNADLRITDPNTGAVIDRVSRISELEAISNWVEQVFQKKLSR